MTFVIECLVCGNSKESPEGRDPAKLEEIIAVMDEMELVCRQCDGPITVRVAGETVAD
jgi:hypothetical protein